MRANVVVAAALLLAGCSSGAGSSGSASTPSTTRSTASTTATSGPAELQLDGHTYRVPDPLPKGDPGQLIATRDVEPTDALAGARRTQLLYHSKDHAGHDRAVSGVLLVPKGQAPKGGWPIVSWGHGTTGVADVCAPSTTDNLFYDEYAQEARSFLDAGYAVVATDYLGLATPGLHPYLVGVEEGMAMADAVTAARTADPSLGARWFAVGHSQGGQAALFATKSPKASGRTAPAAAIAIAPANSLELALPAVAHGDAPADVVYGAYMIAGLSTVDPTVELGDELGAEGKRQEQFILDGGCLVDTYPKLDPDKVDQIFAMSDERAKDLSERVATYGDPERHGVDGPVLVIQGETDQDVPAAVTRNMVATLQAKGDELRYHEYPGLNHDEVVGPSICEQLEFLAAHGGAPVADCTPYPTDLD
ncbi:MAG: prolyl oligopeptidase family serine peptidase [Acidimicrobiales bacterium]